MNAARARLGVIVLSTNLTVEIEFQRMLPEGVTFHIARCRISDSAKDELEKERDFLEMEDQVVEAARQVAMTKPDVILFTCTIGSFLVNEVQPVSLEEKISRVTRIPTVTTATAVIEAIAALKLKSISLVSPYPEAMGQKEKAALERSVPGLKVRTMKHMGVIGSFEKNLIPLALTDRLARDTIAPDAAGLFISCTALRTMELIEPLEQTFQIPVITSTQASLWACLRRCQVKGPSGFGRLFDCRANELNASLR